MKNIKVIQNNIDVTKVVSQLREHESDWETSRNMNNTGTLLDRGYAKLELGILQLIMGAVKNPNDFVGDSEFCVKTPAFSHHTAVFSILRNYFRQVHRCGFLKLDVGTDYGLHIDMGTYYHTRDRYHLSIQGRYEYTVGDEMIVVEPGTLFWFDNKKMHGTKNIGDVPRITFVFDVPMSESSWRK